MPYPKTVKIVEVGPRDGLQNEAKPVSVDTRIELIDRLTACGFLAIESGAFVSPKWVPQMADSDKVFKGITRHANTSYSALVPNLKGYEMALDAGVEEVAVFAAASESFSKTNINCSIDESLTRFEPILERAKSDGIKVRGYISCVLGCPYEGKVEADQVRKIASWLLEKGCYEISLGDTIGTGTPAATEVLLETVQKSVPGEMLAVHFHDTYGQALANVLVALQSGVSVVDSSVSGLGGCPYAQGASGNLATEDLLYMLNGMDIKTGIDLDQLMNAGQYINQYLGRQAGSRAGNAMLNKNSS